MVRPLDNATEAALRRAPLTYAEVGGSLAVDLPPGYDHLDADRTVGHGSDCFERVAEALMTWRLHADSGLRVEAPSQRVSRDDVLTLRPVWAPAPVVLARCRVVTIVDEQDRRGFAYGTLPGHPESGEESFVVTSAPDGDVVVRVRAFAVPASRIARLAPQVTRRVQARQTERYLRAATAAAR